MPALLDRCRRGACVAALLAVALGGCAAVGPDYSEPQLAVPAGWSAGTGTDAMDAVLLARWWHGFGDPVLDRLVADALAANLDLAQARARLREARARRGVAGAALAPSVDASLSGSRSRSSASGVAAGMSPGMSAHMPGRMPAGVAHIVGIVAHYRASPSRRMVSVK